MTIFPLLAVILVAFGGSAVSGDQIANKLIDDLKLGKNTFMRPVAQNETIGVTVGLTVMSIDLNFEEQSLNTDVWIALNWEDPTLKWDPANYGGISRLTIPPSLIWTPDITIYNAFDSEVELAARKDKVLTVVKNDGSVIWILPRNLKTTCRLNVKHQEQKCIIKFGSWVHDAFEIDLGLEANTTSADLSSYEETKWKILSAPATRNEITYSCCPEPYVDVTFMFNIAPVEQTSSGLLGKLKNNMPGLPYWQ